MTMFCPTPLHALPSSRSLTHPRTAQSPRPHRKATLTSLCVSTMLQSTWRHSHKRNSPQPSPHSSLAPPMGTEDFGANESQRSTTEQGWLSSYLSLSATLTCCPLGGLGCSAVLSPGGESNRRADEPFISGRRPRPPISRRSHSDGPLRLTFQGEECHFWFPRTPNQTGNSHVSA